MMKSALIGCALVIATNSYTFAACPTSGVAGKIYYGANAGFFGVSTTAMQASATFSKLTIVSYAKSGSNYTGTMKIDNTWVTTLGSSGTDTTLTGTFSVNSTTCAGTASITGSGVTVNFAVLDSGNEIQGIWVIANSAKANAFRVVAP